MNVKPDGSFDYECAEIKKIIEKLAGIEEKRTQAFHLLLDGNEETKKKLDAALQEYKNGSGQGQETTNAGATDAKARSTAEIEEKDRYIAEEERKRTPINKRDFEDASRTRQVPAHPF